MAVDLKGKHFVFKQKSMHGKIDMPSSTRIISQIIYRPCGADHRSSPATYLHTYLYILFKFMHIYICEYTLHYTMYICRVQWVNP